MHCLNTGGAERFLTDLLLNLDRNRFDPILLLFRGGGKWQAELVGENIPLIILGKSHKMSLKNFYLLVRAIRKIRPQIVHTQLGGDVSGWFAARMLGVPVVVSTEQNINHEDSWRRVFLKKHFYKLADRIVAISRAVEHDLGSRYGYPAQKITVIPNGVDTIRFRALSNRPGAPATSRRLVFGTLGRLGEQKGHRVLVGAWSLLKNEADCLIAGAGPLERQLTDEIKAAGLESRIKLVGPVTDTSGFLASLDAFVFPSLWEGQGLALLEAGLSGLPVIASAVDGISEMLGEETGYPVPAGDAAALAERIDWLIDNINAPEVLTKTIAFRQLILDRYDIKKTAAKYETLYEQLLAEKSHEDTSSQ